MESGAAAAGQRPIDQPAPGKRGTSAAVGQKQKTTSSPERAGASSEGRFAFHDRVFGLPAAQEEGVAVFDQPGSALALFSLRRFGQSGWEVILVGLRRPSLDALDLDAMPIGGGLVFPLAHRNHLPGVEEPPPPSRTRRPWAGWLMGRRPAGRALTLSHAPSGRAAIFGPAGTRRALPAGVAGRSCDPRSLQIILSDDCSEDRSFAIMREMAAAYRGPHTVELNRATSADPSVAILIASRNSRAAS